MIEHGNASGDDAVAALSLSLGEDPLTVLESAAWALAAAVATQREAASTPIEEVLAAQPERTAVLARVGLVEQGPQGPVPHASLRADDAVAGGARAEARLSALRQLVAVAAGETPAGWADHEDAVLLNQGRASAGTGRALAQRVVPALDGLADLLAAPGARVLDVGTGVAALAIALARSLPGAEVLGIDIAERPLALAQAEIEAAADVAGRVSVRRQDVAQLADEAAFDLVWLPAPFMAEEVLVEAVPRLVAALREGGWLVVGTNPVSPDPLRAAVARWNAARSRTSAYDAGRATEQLAANGLRDVRSFPTVPGGPVLVAGRRPARDAA